jgi:hypothetical protein
MHQQHAQRFCSDCGRSTLHVADVRDPQHVLHLLMCFGSVATWGALIASGVGFTLRINPFLGCALTTGGWVCVWIAEIMVRSSATPTGFRCARCGLGEGDTSFTERTEAETRSRTQLREECEKAWRHREAARAAEERVMRRLRERSQDARLATARAVRSAISWYDGLLRAVSGDGGEILYWFLWLLTSTALALAIACGFAWTLRNHAPQRNPGPAAIEEQLPEQSPEGKAACEAAAKEAARAIPNHPDYRYPADEYNATATGQDQWTVQGFCSITLPGEPLGRRGWVAKMHRKAGGEWECTSLLLNRRTEYPQP